jgi:hypothetical protein
MRNEESEDFCSETALVPCCRGSAVNREQRAEEDLAAVLDGLGLGLGC